MERPHSLRRVSLSALVGSWTRILAWVCLLFVASTSGYWVQLALAATISTAADDGLGVAQLHGLALQDAARTSTHMVLITGQDATTGDRVQVECATTSDRVAIDALVVELKHLGELSAQLCSSSAPVQRPGSPY
jgi:hypothetical protein